MLLHVEGGDVVIEHNQLRDASFDFCHQAHLGVQVEIGSTLAPDGSRSHPADVLVHDWIAGRFAAFDFTVSSPLSVASLCHPPSLCFTESSMHYIRLQQLYQHPGFN